MSNTEIAAELVLSPHTVRDHLKAVFSKTDVRSRAASLTPWCAPLNNIAAPGNTLCRPAPAVTETNTP